MDLGKGNSGESRPPLPAGFPGCRRCSYRWTSEPDVCLGCCLDRVTEPDGASCPVCGQPLGPEPGCGNDWCTRADRWFSAVWSVRAHTGDWRRVLAEYKYHTATWWAPVLARVLVGYLDEHMPWFDEFDLLMPMPAYRGRSARRPWDPLGELAAAAAQVAGPSWYFESGLVVKDRETPALVGLSRGARRAAAEGPLRQALRVPEPAAVRGARVLVVDDVFTEGSTLREVARALVLAGADEVAGLTLARQPWSRAGPPQAPGVECRGA